MKNPFVFLAALFTAGTALAYDSTVVFNEIQYHPADGQSEWIEVRNLHGVDINVAGWKLTGAVDYTFPLTGPGSIISGHGYLLIAAVPAQLPGSLGPLSGSLNNSGETIRIRNLNGRIMDELTYSDGGDWPVGADGSGATLARLDGTGAAEGASSWVASTQIGGTPGERNFLTTPQSRSHISYGAAWKFRDADTAPPADWKDLAFVDTAWSSGNAALGAQPASTALTVTTNLVARYRAGAITGVAEGATVPSWTDTATGDGVSQNGAAGATTPTFRGTSTPNGKPAVRFDGNDEFRTSLPPGITATDGFAYFVVLKGNATQTSDAYIFDRTVAGNPLASLRTQGGFYALQKRYTDGSGLGGPVSTSAISSTAWQMVAVRRNRALNRFEMWVDGVMQSSQTDTGGALTPDPINIGRHFNSQGFNGDIAELLIYKDGLTDADFQQVGAYLNGEYGLKAVTALAPTAPVAYLRKSFTFPGDPSRASLQLDHTIADGAVFYLNGTEILRTNLPAGPVDHNTTAPGPIPAPAASGLTVVPSGALRNGTNVLAVSLHKAAGSTASLFDAALESVEQPPSLNLSHPLQFSEIPGAGDPGFFVELVNVSNAALDTAGWTLRTSTNLTVALPAASIPAGGLFTLTAATLGFTPLDGMKFFLTGPGATTLSDARAVTNRPRGLVNGGLWGHPTTATPGGANVAAVNKDIVINEIFYHALQDGPEQWIELYNKGAAAVDIGGWKISDAVSFVFPAASSIPAGGYLVVAWDPAAFAALHPASTPLGPWDGNLSGSGETITLRDANDNIANQVTYADGGRWSGWADGGGSSLELMDPRADNTNPGVWDSSDESLATSWKSYTITGTGAHATTSGLTYYHEFLMGLLDGGEILIDDISVKEVNVGNRELIQNGTFADGTTTAWRNIGTHRGSTVVDDPFQPGEKVLKLSATGGTEHMNNNAGTTLKNGASYVALATGSTYTISFRAKWLRGTNRLHTRLYFNRLSRQTLLDLPVTGGTPGAVNSRRVINAGPTLQTATVSPVVPNANSPATVEIQVSDPDGISSVTLFTSLNGAAFTSAPMTTGGNGLYTAAVPGRPTGSKVQFYVQATDTPGAVSLWPAAGADSRAMIPWQDGKSIPVTPAGARPHNLRIVITGADANTMYLAENVQSNEYVPCTVILDDNEVWYEAGTRLKSSEHGRFQENRVGYNLKFGSDNPFLGAHETISVDRSGNRTTEGLDGSTVTSQREILVKTVSNAAGGIYAVEDDLIRVIPPIATGTPAPAFSGLNALGEAILTKSRFDDEYLDAQWENGGDGPIFKQEYIYPLTQTIHPTTRAVTSISSSGNLNASAEQHKIAQTGGSPGPSGIAVRAYAPPAGTDPKENYRWHWLIRNAKDKDDFSGLIAGITAVGQAGGGAAFKTQTNAAINVDAWLRAAVPAKLFGATDNYLANTGSTHNFLFYFPPGEKGVAIPWDLDFLAQSNSSAPITGGGDIDKFIADPVNKRRFYGHVLDVLNRSFNDAFLTRWATHYSTFGVDDMTSSLPFLRARATYVGNLVNGTGGQTAPVPKVAFARTSAATMDVATPFATILGNGWIDIENIRLEGSPEPLAVTWTGQSAWSLPLPLFNGTRTYTLEGVRKDGTIAGTTTVTVTSTSGILPAAADNLVVSKVHYHPAGPSAAEITAGYTTEDDFEYLELQNISAFPVDLSKTRFGAGIDYTFDDNLRIPQGGRLILPRRSAAFALRHPGVATAREYFLAADPTGNKLSDNGETLTLLSAAGPDIKSFSYDDIPPWPTAADGTGSALTLISPMGNPDHTAPSSWKASTVAGGAPGTADGVIFTGDPTADSDADGLTDLVDFAIGAGTPPTAIFTGPASPPVIRFTVDRDTAVQANTIVEVSTDPAAPQGWSAVPGSALISRTPVSGTVERLVFAIPSPPASTRTFVRARFTSP